MEIKDRFKEARKLFDTTQCKCSQSHFGELFGISRDVVANIENGRVAPSDLLIDAVCRKTGLSREWLATGEGPMRPIKTREEEIAELVAQALDGDSNLKKAVIQMICTRTDQQLRDLEDALVAVYEGLKRD